MQQTPRPPEGTIALLFTDIEGSTRLATILGEAWSSVLADHHALVGAAIEAQGGFVDGTEGDAFLATFVDARAAGRAAVGALRALREHPWPAGVGELKVRMGLHVGHVERTETGYVGLEVHRAARVAAAAHGGQLIMTSVARDLIGDQLVTESLGSHRLKDFPGAVPLFCAVVDGRGAGGFPRPRTEEVRPTNLPAGAPVLVGRDDDVDRVRDALQRDHERVVTVTGRGGAGKTSLALGHSTAPVQRSSTVKHSSARARWSTVRGSSAPPWTPWTGSGRSHGRRAPAEGFVGPVVSRLPGEPSSVTDSPRASSRSLSPRPTAALAAT